VLICFDPGLKKRGGVPKLVIAPATDAEVLTGSTRLKAGTATKLILNCITTLAFARVGKVAGNRMIDLDPKNEKLRDRAVRIASELSGAEPAVSQAALEGEGWVLKKALDRLESNGNAGPVTGCGQLQAPC
jgi:N-acetylmuramic acid 6-phosphate etherase